MTNKIKEALFKATLKYLQPLVRILLANGISHEEFSEATRYAFVKVAEKEFPEPSTSGLRKQSKKSKKQSSSYLSGLTGINRKYVAQIRKDLEQGNLAVESAPRSAKIIQMWRSNKKYLNAEGTPLSLPREGSISFSSLLEDCNADMTVTTAFGLLKESGSCVYEDDLVRLTSDGGYQPSEDESQMIRIMGEHSSGLVETLTHNLRRDISDEQRLFEKAAKVYELKNDDIAKVNDFLADEGSKWIDKVDAFMESLKDEHGEIPEDEKRMMAGVGLYLFSRDATKNTE